MCKEDVRIKRKTARRSIRVAGAFTFPGRLLKANPERCALILTTADITPALATVGDITVGPLDNGAVMGIMAVCPFTPYMVLTIEQVGIALTEEMWAASSFPLTDFTLTEIYWEVTLESIH